MPVARKMISFAQQIAIDRHYNAYDMGGCWDPFNRKAPTDCSDCAGKELTASVSGTAMSWARQVSTESWRPPSMGGNADPNNGPYGTVMVNDPSEFPPDAAVLVALHHGDGSAADSHMWVQVDKLKVETHGSSDEFPNGATVLYDGKNFLDDVLDVHTVDSATTYGANNWWYLPGPIAEDGTPIPTAASGGTTPAAPDGTLTEAPDTIYPDVSEFQAPVDDSFLAATYTESGQQFPYRWLCIRSNDGDHVDENFAPNYAWATKQLDAGNLDGLIVYYYWRPDGSGLTNHMQLVNSQGGPHPQMVSMMDVESGDGNGSADVSTQLNTEYSTLAGWLGNAARVIGYGNQGDLASMWPTSPNGLMVVVAGYGSNPNLPNQIAHQYTNGQGYGGGLPEGVPPWPSCDMNSADGYTPTQLAVALGISGATPSQPVEPITPPTPAPAAPLSNAQMQDMFNMTLLIWQQVGGLLTAMPLLPGSPTPMPVEWPASLAQILAPPAAAAKTPTRKKT
jgi:hypothetical protein